MKRNLIAGLVCILAVSVSLNVVAQDKKKSAKAEHGHAHDEEGAHKHDDGKTHEHEKEKGHAHAAPHGGTVVKLGKHAFNLEFVRDPDEGKFHVYVLDGHMEYVDVAEKSFELVAKLNGKTERVTLSRAAAPGTTTVAEQSSSFVGQADWIKSAKKFQGTIPEITLRGQTFRKVSFAFPKAAAKAHAH